MKSTGEVMGVGYSFAEAFAKSQLGAGVILPTSGKAFLSVRDADKAHIAGIGQSLLKIGFSLVATNGTAKVLMDAGMECEVVTKVGQGRPHIVDIIKNDEISLIINTTEGTQAIADSATIRSNALQHKVTYTTTISGGRAFCMAMQEKSNKNVYNIQSLHKDIIEA